MEENVKTVETAGFKPWLKKTCNKFFITAFSGMAQGLFCTLIAGTILAQIAGWIGDNYFGKTLMAIANAAKSLMGAGIGVGIAHSLKKGKLIVFSSAVAGFVGAFADKLTYGAAGFTALTLGAPGNPIGAYVVTMLVAEVTDLYEGKTKLDIILIPMGRAFTVVYRHIRGVPVHIRNKQTRSFNRACDERHSVYNGHSYIRYNGHTFNDAHVFRGDMGIGCKPRFNERTRRLGRIQRNAFGGRGGGYGLRLPHGGFCGRKLPRKRRGRAYLARDRNEHAANPQHYEKARNYGARNYIERDFGARCYLRV